MKTRALPFVLLTGLSLFSGCASQTLDEPVAASANANGAQEAYVTVKHGYHPNHIAASAGQALTLNFYRDEGQGHSCAQTLVIPALGIKADLPAQKTYTVAVPAEAAHGTLDFHCDMDMMKGRVTFADADEQPSAN